MGVLFSVLWVVGHGYVLAQTGENRLLARCVDMMLGLSLLLPHLVLCHASSQERRAVVRIFFILSMASLTLYWAWFGYLKYGVGDGEASKEVK